MRIISGTHKGRRIIPPAKMPLTRPTTDVAKEGLFNVLQNYIEFDEIKSLDLFGGTGSISYELASRGCSDLTIVEKDRKMYSFIHETSAQLKFESKFNLYNEEVFSYLNKCNEKFDFIFAGPPYALSIIDDIPELIFQRKLLNESGIFVLEHTPRNNYEEFPYFSRVLKYGTTLFSIFILK